ncbi:MAG TPA: IscS subfamily cysteine desulfurase [Ktedonobacter sp.]|nr:IscS subfamily cysteine desulfurase [Ktedonobacter sp.]HBE25619.1 IscS subfamily cysteine desulfurase [Ktedonobacter sp.]
MPKHDTSSRHPIYMDHHATTPVDPRVLEVMLPYFTQCFGNAASIDHEYGGEAFQAVENARRQVAQLINATYPDEIVFTSGATEADNLAVLGVAEQYSDKGKHIITCVTEHRAVLDPCEYLESKGWQITRLPVDQYGLVDSHAVQRAITPQTVLISIMTANNEIGTIAPIAEIGRIARQHEVLFHTDATQAVGHVPIDVEGMNIDMLSMSAHKFYGPKGIGALYVRKRQPRVKLVSQMHGGGHERGMRSGTLNVPGIVGMGKAAEIARLEMKAESQRLRGLRDQLWEGLQANIEGAQLNGHPTQRLPHNLSVFIPGIESRALVVQIKHEVALSTGSACTTAKVEPSHVILALGFGDDRAHSSVRFGLGRGNTWDDIYIVITLLANSVRHLQDMALQ